MARAPRHGIPPDLVPDLKQLARELGGSEKELSPAIAFVLKRHLRDDLAFLTTQKEKAND